MTSKKIYLSKTFLAAVIAILCAGAQLRWGWVLGPEYQIMILAVVMGALRVVTENKVVFFSERKVKTNALASPSTLSTASTDPAIPVPDKKEGGT